jgi:hypothetical protein
VSTRHILDAIDGALDWDGHSDAMRWTPPEEEALPPLPPPPCQPPLLRSQVRRVTVIVETDDDRVEVLEVPYPRHSDVTMEAREEPPRWSDPYSFGAGAVEVTVGVDVTAGEGGITHWEGHVFPDAVLRRLAGRAERSGETAG